VSSSQIILLSSREGERDRKTINHEAGACFSIINNDPARDKKCLRDRSVDRSESFQILHEFFEE